MFLFRQSVLVIIQEQKLVPKPKRVKWVKAGLVVDGSKIRGRRGRSRWAGGEEEGTGSML